MGMQYGGVFLGTCDVIRGLPRVWLSFQLLTFLGSPRPYFPKIETDAVHTFSLKSPFAMMVSGEFASSKADSILV